jgi:hypothetical protein
MINEEGGILRFLVYFGKIDKTWCAYYGEFG